ncbi:IclR family transcriptional regulator [Hyphococcus sp.]|uniref:IclR family transcriptional regulator n=1 Tax=Hyphococcus sp. TaxID=2038636 RepID=UPI003CCB92EA
MTEKQPGAGLGIKSVKNAFKILDTVARRPGPVSLKEISLEAGVSPSKAHRYLQSLCACGLLSQAKKSGNYDLGMTAMRLGLTAVNRVDIINRAGEAIPMLAQALDVDVCLTVWSDLGPTVVRFERCKHPSAAMLGPGVAFPVLSSATGQVFLAFAETGLVEALRKREISRAGPGNEINALGLDQKLAEIRAAGYAKSSGVLLPGRYCCSAPIISIDDHIVAAVSIISAHAGLIDPGEKYIEKLMAFCRKYSLPKKGYLEETLMEQKIAV